MVLTRPSSLIEIIKDLNNNDNNLFAFDLVLIIVGYENELKKCVSCDEDCQELQEEGIYYCHKCWNNYENIVATTSTLKKAVPDAFADALTDDDIPEEISM